MSNGIGKRKHTKRKSSGIGSKKRISKGSLVRVKTKKKPIKKLITTVKTAVSNIKPKKKPAPTPPKTYTRDPRRL